MKSSTPLASTRSKRRPALRPRFEAEQGPEVFVLTDELLTSPIGSHEAPLAVEVQDGTGHGVQHGLPRGVLGEYSAEVGFEIGGCIRKRFADGRRVVEAKRIS